MKKALALAVLLSISGIPKKSFADHLVPIPPKDSELIPKSNKNKLF